MSNAKPFVKSHTGNCPTCKGCGRLVNSFPIVLGNGDCSTHEYRTCVQCGVNFYTSQRINFKLTTHKFVIGTPGGEFSWLYKKPKKVELGETLPPVAVPVCNNDD